MKWQNKIYTTILEAEESAEGRVSSNIARLRKLGALGDKKVVGPPSHEIQKLKAETLKLITKGGLMKSPKRGKRG